MTDTPKRPAHRPKLPPGVARVWISCRVEGETLTALKVLAAKHGLSGHGRLLDFLIKNNILN